MLLHKLVRITVEKLQRVLNWHAEESRPLSDSNGKFDPLLALRGSGRDLWADEHADEYVNRLRSNWESQENL